MLRLSIIVPIYNVEKYLHKCVDSLLLQDLSGDEYEIILVDDGATDNSGNIADEYVALYDNINVIHQANAGLSEARNAGIKVAQGKYVMFVDSDDYLKPNVLKGLVGKMEHDDLDVLRFNYQNVNEQGQVFEPNKVSKPYVDYTDEICDGEFFLNNRLGGACYVVQFIIKREFVLLFTPGIYFEDVDWTPRMLLQAKRVTSVDTMVYNYLYRIGTISRTKDTKRLRKRLDDDVYIIKGLKKLSDKCSDRRWFDMMCTSITIGMLNNVAANFFADRKHWLNVIKDLNVYPLTYWHLTPMAIRKAKLINLSPSLYCWIIHLKSK